MSSTETSLETKEDKFIQPNMNTDIPSKTKQDKKTTGDKSHISLCTPTKNPVCSVKTPISPLQCSSKTTPSPQSKVPVFEHMKRTIQGYGTQTDTQLRAALYSLSEGDIQDVKSTLQDMRGTLHSFKNQQMCTLNEAALKFTALQQQVNTIRQHSSQVSREKKELMKEIDNLKKHITNMETKGLNQMLESDFTDVQEDDDTNEPPLKKSKDSDSLN